MRVAAGLTVSVLAFLWSGSADATADPPEAPPFVGGIVDARAQLVVVAGESGGIEAVDLNTGKRRWSSREGTIPLYAGLDVAAVASLDRAGRRLLRVRLLSLTDGRRVAESKGIELPAWVSASNISIAAWAGVSSARPNA